MSKQLISPKKDRTGQIQGRLAVIGFNSYRLVGQGHRVAFWNVRCSCGKELSVSQPALNGGQQSCGCYLREFQQEHLPALTRERNRREPGVAAFNGVVSSYRCRAQRKGRSFDLTPEQFRELTQQPCHYCGSPPETVFTPRGENGSYVYNGIDRLSSAEGYTLANSVPCCEICNKAKRDLTPITFHNWISRLIAHASTTRCPN